MVKIIVLFSQKLLSKAGGSNFTSSDIGLNTGPDLQFKANDPNVDDDTLRRYYSVEIENVSEAEKLVDTLLKVPGVEASWVKPKEGPPG